MPKTKRPATEVVLVSEKNRLYRQEDLLLHVTQQVHEISLKKKVSRSKLAKKVGISTEQITRWMGGEDEPSLRDVADLFWALGKKVELQVSELSGKIPQHVRGGHLIARTDGVLCTVCGEIEPIHPGKSGTPIPSLLHGYRNAVSRHPEAKHDPHVPQRGVFRR